MCPLLHGIISLSLVWASSLLPVCCNPPIPSPSPRLPALLSLGAAWGDGCGFGQWCLQSVYRRTASALSRLPQSHRLRCCTLGQTCLLSDRTTRRLEAADIRTRSSLSTAWGKMQHSREALFHVYKGWWWWWWWWGGGRGYCCAAYIPHKDPNHYIGSDSAVIIFFSCFLYDTTASGSKINNKPLHHNPWAQRSTVCTAAEWKAGYYDETASHSYWWGELSQRSADWQQRLSAMW